jgi:hypothetical protein
VSGDDHVKATTAELASTQREDVLRAVLDDEGSESVTGGSGLAPGTVPPAAEWIDLADAGGYLDETKMPLFTPNGDGSGGTQSSDNADTELWMRESLKRIARTPPSDDEN